MIKSTALTLLLICGGTAALSAENWPQWRGPSLNGLSGEKNLPVRWSTAENITWKLHLHPHQQVSLRYRRATNGGAVTRLARHSSLAVWRAEVGARGSGLGARGSGLAKLNRW
jgi:hypothetical protein